jgi:hypothetical protein
MSPDCERVRELAAELALGIADGQDRARALDHLAECAGCRAAVERLSAVADELLLIAPAAEPPPGFEARAAETMRPAPARPGGFRRRVALALAVAAALGVAAVAAGATWLALGDDRELADSYRETLAVANGEYFDAAPLELPGGEQVGYVYGYQGRASWVLALIYDGVKDGTHRVELVARKGEKLPLGELEVAGGEGSTGAAIPIDYERLTEVRLLDDRGREVADSELWE